MAERYRITITQVGRFTHRITCDCQVWDDWWYPLWTRHRMTRRRAERYAQRWLAARTRRDVRRADWEKAKLVFEAETRE